MTRYLTALVPAALWTALVLLALQFRGAHVGGPACWTDPGCDDPIAWNEIVIWAIGIMAILIWAARRRGVRIDWTWTGRHTLVLIAVTALALVIFEWSRENPGRSIFPWAFH